MLGALLPQVREAVGEVEVIILDNASSDHTQEVVAIASRCYPVRYYRREKNAGPTTNIISGPALLATGDFSWILGHHNLIAPGALAYMLAAIRKHAELDVFQINYRCANYPEQWPDAADGGYSGPAEYQCRSAVEDRTFDRWEQLIETGPVALCTQSYAPVVRTEIWRRYWTGRETGPDYTSGPTTYPHSWMLGAVCYSSPVRYLGRPLITIFNGAQSWSDPAIRKKVILSGLPDLVNLFEDCGLNGARLKEARNFAGENVRSVMTQFFSFPSHSGLWALCCELLMVDWRKRWVLRCIWEGFLDADFSPVGRGVRKAGRIWTAARRYFFHNCRPARWYRKRRQAGC